MLRRSFRSGERTVLFFLVLVASYVLVGIFAPVLAPASPGDQDHYALERRVKIELLRGGDEQRVAAVELR